MDLITPTQCRAARGLLKWSQPDLSKQAGIHIQTICAFENETGTPTKTTLQKITIAFEKEGVELTSGHGVKLFTASIKVLHGEEGIKEFLDDIYNTVTLTGGDVLIVNNAEPFKQKESILSYLKMHLKRLEHAGIKERILICEDDTNFLAPPESYRWLPKENFCAVPTIIYANKIAMKFWGPPARVTIINDPQYAESMRNLFEFSWKSARIPT